MTQKIRSGQIKSGAAEDGQVLTADGAGGSSWEDVEATSIGDHAHDGEAGEGGQLEAVDALLSSGASDGDVLTADGAGNVAWEAPAGGGGALALDDLTDVNAPDPDDDDVLTWDETAGEWVAAAPTGGGGGASTFLQLTDTPANYTGQAGKYVVVKDEEDGLFFVDAPIGGLEYEDMLDAWAITAIDAP